MDELNYYKYKSNSEFDKSFKSYKVNELAGMIRCPKEGKYYFVISNAYSNVRSKKVKYLVFQDD